MKSKNILIALVLVALAASLFVVPTLGHPFWSEEAEEGEEFTPPCLSDNGTRYWYPPWYNGAENGEEFTPPCIEGSEYPRGYPPWLDELEEGVRPEEAPYGYRRGGCGGFGGSGYGRGRGGWETNGRSRGIFGGRRG